MNGRPLMKLSVVHFPHFFLSSLQNSLYMLFLELRSAVESWLFLKLVLTNVSTKLFKPCHITLHPWDFFPPLLGVFFYKHWLWTQIYNMFPDVFPVHEKTSSVPMISHTHTHTHTHTHSTFLLMILFLSSEYTLWKQLDIWLSCYVHCIIEDVTCNSWIFVMI